MLIKHRIRFIYSFRHCITSGSNPKAHADTANRLRSLQKKWAPWAHGLNEEDLCWAVDDSYFFHPVLRGLLYPETALEECRRREVKEQAKRIRKFTENSLDRYAAQLHPHGVLRLQLRDDSHEILSPASQEHGGWRIQSKLRYWEAAIRGIQMWLFPNRIGFLDLEIVLVPEAVGASDLRDFLEAARWIHPKNYTYTPAQWQSLQTRCGAIDGRLLVDYLTDGLTPETRASSTKLCEYVSDERPRMRYTSTEESQRSATFRYFLYACLNAEPGKDDSRIFDNAAERVLYELANPQARCGHPDYTPHGQAVERFRRENHIAFWNCWEGATVANAVVLLGTRPEGFAVDALPGIAFADYFPAYLLTRYQHERLNDLATDVQQSSGRLRENRGKALGVWNDFLLFRNRYWFVEATTTSQGNELYRRFQAACGLPEIITSLSTELVEIREHYEQTDERRTAQALAVLTLAGLPATLALALFSLEKALLDEWGWCRLGLAFLGFLAFSLTLFYWRWFRRWLQKLSPKFTKEP